jgi:hypothetical protein
VELLIAVNPDPDSRLPYLLRLGTGPGKAHTPSDFHGSGAAPTGG